MGIAYLAAHFVFYLLALLANNQKATKKTKLFSGNKTATFFLQ